ncbi:MAG: GDP-mannose 4,6-dehydratase [Candidatus Omnitrophica bacterium CG07_land_8_20_14_0_80_50_8]|nr:MAG: GDP-mannose 4,6-dehydratase [Candidatus Omnitrophica bacterium CG1_02_49_16]PIU40405.1 MAG: GDP-mannose 4,6-dehydratase [Candidatus Omnitrophica bacterium CG07_land_8_20_14_0_80_50_8]
MKILITGIRGFVGTHLAEFLLDKKDVQIHGIARGAGEKRRRSKTAGKVFIHNCDLRDASSVDRILKKVRPDWVFHLAAQSFVPRSWENPAQTLTNNTIGQLNLLESLKTLKIRPRVHIAGSSEEYGKVDPSEIPMKETNPLRPLSPYGVSKVTQDLLAYQYYQSFHMDLVRTRAFSHTGPGQTDVFVASNFAKQIARIEAGKQSAVIHVGNLEAVRDFTDVRDMVRAYWLALEKGKAGEVYNICSEAGHPIKEIVAIYLKACALRVKVKEDPSRIRPSDVPILVGDGRKFFKQTGWTPRILFKETLLDLLNYWRKKIGS